MKAYYSILFAFAILVSCKKKSEDKVNPKPPCGCLPPISEYKCTTCKSTPSAKAAYDNSNLGVYKGVLIGSSGTFTITLQENDTTATLSFDGTTLVLTKTSLTTMSDNVVATFSNGSTVLTISVSSSGTAASVTANIPGHPSILTSVVKEKSDRLVKAFEGSYSGTNNSSGVFNMVVIDSDVHIIWKGGSSNGKIDGTVSGNTMTGGGGSQVSAKGSFSDADNVTGTWSQDTDTGTWSGKRTL